MAKASIMDFILAGMQQGQQSYLSRQDMKSKEKMFNQDLMQRQAENDRTYGQRQDEIDKTFQLNKGTLDLNTKSKNADLFGQNLVVGSDVDGNGVLDKAELDPEFVKTYGYLDKHDASFDFTKQSTSGQKMAEMYGVGGPWVPNQYYLNSTLLNNQNVTAQNRNKINDDAAYQRGSLGIQSADLQLRRENAEKANQTYFREPQFWTSWDKERNTWAPTTYKTLEERNRALQGQSNAVQIASDPYLTMAPMAHKDGKLVRNTNSTRTIAAELNDPNNAKFYQDITNVKAAFGDQLAMQEHNEANNVTKASDKTMEGGPVPDAPDRKQPGVMKTLTYKEYFQNGNSAYTDWLGSDPWVNWKEQSEGLNAQYQKSKNLESEAMAHSMNLLKRLATVADPDLRQRTANSSGLLDFIGRLEQRRDKMLSEDGEMAGRANAIINAYNSVMGNGYFDTRGPSKEELLNQVSGKGFHDTPAPVQSVYRSSIG